MNENIKKIIGGDGKKYDFQDVDPSIIFYLKNTSPLLEEPIENSVKIMDIIKDSKIIILRRNDPDNIWWCNIRTLDGKEGWLKENNLERRNIN